MEKRIQKNFRHILLLVCLFSVLFLTGCDTEPYSKDEVIEMTKEECGEDFTLLYSEKLTDYHIKYTFETTERKIRFTVNNALTGGAPIPCYYRSYTCDYTYVVHDFYHDRIRKVLEQSPLYKGGEFHIFQYDDLEEIAKTAEKCNKIYAEELAYNSEEFLKKNPAGSIQIKWFPSSEAAKNDNDWTHVNYCNIDGCSTKDDILSALQNKYTELCADGTIYDNDYYPSHVQKLDKIYVNGKRMKSGRYCSYTVITSSESHNSLEGLEGFKIPEDDLDNAPYAWYNYDLQQYMTNIDASYGQYGLCLCSIIPNFTETLGGSCTINLDNHTIKWTIGKDSWFLQGYDDIRTETIQIEKIIKNGKELPVSAVTIREDKNVRGINYAGISLDDFSKLFNLEYTIDENKGSVYFTTKDKKEKREK